MRARAIRMTRRGFSTAQRTSLLTIGVAQDFGEPVGVDPRPWGEWGPFTRSRLIPSGPGAGGLPGPPSGPPAPRPRRVPPPATAALLAAAPPAEAVRGRGPPRECAAEPS